MSQFKDGSELDRAFRVAIRKAGGYKALVEIDEEMAHLRKNDPLRYFLKKGTKDKPEKSD